LKLSEDGAANGKVGKRFAAYGAEETGDEWEAASTAESDGGDCAATGWSENREMR
jgi:hypothetical protein